MPDLPDQWSAYARLQEKLARRQQIDDYTWGLEAGLNRVLDKKLAVEEVEVDRAVRSESRKERYQEHLRRLHPLIEESAGNPDDAVDARRRLRVVIKLAAPEEWSLLRAVAEGYEYKEIAAVKKTAAGTLRARVLRLRRTLVALAS
jgi:DNA-binding NarL/FixJ family response regulator